MRRKHHLRKKIAIKSFLEYGYHLWVLLIISNFLILYSFNFFSFGAEPKKVVSAVTPGVSNAADLATSKVPFDPNAPTATPTFEPTPTTTPTPVPPKGPVINLSFTVPGIGSGGGTLKPLNPTRNLIVYLYATDVNSNDNKVRPVFTMRTKATFNTDKASPLYMTFRNPKIDLGDTVKDGTYQVAFTTDQSMRKLVKEKEDSIGGMSVRISRNQPADLPLQKVVMGDMSPPEGNNVMDIADYNLFVACYTTYPKCTGAKQVDLNDDGKLDGIDYNLMALGFQSLVKMGIAPPQLPTAAPTQVSKLSELKVSPKPSAAQKPTVASKLSPSPAVQKSSGGSPIAGILGFFFFLLILGGGAFVLLKTKFGKDLLAKLPLPAKKSADGQTKQPDAAPAEAAPAEPQPDAPPSPDTPPPADPAAPPPAEEPASADPAALAESTEIPIESLKAEKEAGAAAPAETPAAEAPAAQTPPTEVSAGTPPADAAPAAPAADSSAIDKTYYVKNKSKDDKGTWVVLTDEAGPIDGLYKGDIEDGFERIKGTMVEENGKKYLNITEVLPSEG